MKNKTYSFFLVLLTFAFCLLPFSSGGQVAWTNALDLGLSGQAWTDLENPFDRLPAKAKGVVRDPVWSLGTNSAGLSVQFQTNSKTIRVKWVVRYGNSMWHMTDCGIRGVDLYVLDGATWQYAGSGSPGSGKAYEREILSGMDGEMHDYQLNLPLYDGIDSLWIGVEEGTELLPVDLFKGKPVVIYGTSIQQGGCASRPGMAASHILSRMLNQEVINLGFSGNGRMEPELAELIAEIDASVYILDCLPNIHELDVIVPRYTDFVRFMQKKRPGIPIILVETATTVKSAINATDKMQLDGQNEQLRKAYAILKQEGIKELYLIQGSDLIGTDGEGTVDGVHYTDLGFMRYAGKVNEAIGQIVN